MHRALVNLAINMRGELLHLEEGKLIDLDALTPGEVDFLVAAEYVEMAKGTKAKAETPEGKQAKPESR